jgi:succinate-semialdehyde dehydrogenase/glutarate-semialdehyde dehydrogenase
MDLNAAQLFKQQNLINHQWVDAEDNSTIEVANPFDNKMLGKVPKMGRKETQLAIQAAHVAFQQWKKTTAKERSLLLQRWAELIQTHKSDLATIMTLEQGKPLKESMTEIDYGNSFVTWFAEEGKRVYGDIIPTISQDRRLLVTKEPVGVCGIITPWNFPIAMILRKCAPALAAGCTVVVKPAEFTPFSALALGVLAQEAGIPAGVINIITGDPISIGEELCQNTKVNKLSFTGSTRVGKLLMQQCGDTVKKLSLELGGNAPFIIFEDADVDRALEGLMVAKFRNCGQACVGANRIYIHESLQDKFIPRFVEQVKSLKTGNGLEETTHNGPLINIAAVQKVQRLVKDAETKGAKILCGGKVDPSSSNAFQPTVVTHIPNTAEIEQEEIFGPVAALYTFKNEQEVITLANNTRYGLAAYFYSKEISRVWRVAEALEYGMIGINQGLISNEATPFGGIKESGFGREGSKYGIEDYLNIKYICMGI